MDILVFDGPFFWLSNFFSRELEYRGLTFQNSEAAYQAEKCLDPYDKFRFMYLNPSEAKKQGRRVQIRPDWDQIKDQVMYEVCMAKFSQNRDLLKKLLATDGLLVEGNTWGDKYWGQVNGVGRNQLGITLMRIREEFSFKGSKMKKVILVAGIPGSGKTTYIQNLIAGFDPKTTVVVVSADHYFMKDGEYRYVADQIPKAHAQCKFRFLEALDMDIDVIFVDNTNILNKHRKPYVEEALDNNYEVEIHALPADVDLSASRNVHGVDREVCQRMKDSFDLEFGTIYNHEKMKIGFITREQVGMPEVPSV